MDLKRVQEELRNDISHHQTLMEMLKRTPQDQALILKLKAVQRHIAELGAKQKRIILASRDTQTGHILPTASSIKSDGKIGSNATSKPDNHLQIKSSQGFNTAGKLTASAQLSSNAAVSNSATTYTLITIKNGPQPAFTSANKGVHGSANVPINLSQLAVRPTSISKSFPAPSTLLVVSSANQMPVKPVGNAVLPQNSISLTSLVSTGGVVTLPGWKNNQQPSCSNNVGEAVGRLVPAKQVQIKVPVVQSPTNPLILMPQKSPASSQQKSLFRLLPKGRHPIPVNSVQATTVSSSVHKVVPSPQISKSVIQKNPIPAIMMPSDPSKSQPVQQIFVPRMGNLTTVGAPPTSVTWQDLSSKTPAIHKPSYVPRKTFPNINNGVGSFQKFRILDGKAQILPKSGQENAIAGNSGSVTPGSLEKPKHAALKAVLTSSKTPLSAAGTVTLARLVPASVPKSGFFPIQQKQDSATPKPSLPVPSIYSLGSNESPFVPVPVTTASASSFRPIIASVSSSSAKNSERNTPVLDEEAKAKMSFLRNIDLIPKEQAEKVRGRRFRKRRVAANPVYSGGMYVSNELEPKRQCPDPMANAIESIRAPDVIVKRPRGRPRGSKNFAPTALRLQSSTRGTRTSPSLPANVEEIRKLRGILDAVASKGAADSDNKKRDDLPDRSRGLSHGSRLSETSKSDDEAGSSEQKSGENADEHEDQCAKCGKTGEVLMCDTCSRVYHLSCTTPPLTTVPQGMWVCSKCKTEFKESKPKVEWPGIVSVVHSFMEFDKNREKEIESQQEKLEESKKVIAALQTQIKTLNSVVLAKAAARSKTTKERQALLKDIGDFNTLVQNVWNQVTRGGGSATTSTN